MSALLWLIDSLLSLYMWVIIIQVVLSWLVAFNVVNTRNRFIYAVGDTLYRLTEPVMGPVRRLLPNLGGIDISPIIVLLLIGFTRKLLADNAGYLVS
jgi:YggT family protein